MFHRYHDYTRLYTVAGTECWYVAIVCIMYRLSLVYQVFQTTVKIARRQTHKLLVYIVFHVLPLSNTSFSKIVACKIQTAKEMFQENILIKKQN